MLLLEALELGYASVHALGITLGQESVISFDPKDLPPTSKREHQWHFPFTITINTPNYTL